MRTLLFACVASTVPAVAFAWDSEVEDITFTGEVELFRGTEYSQLVPSGGALGFEISADTLGHLTFAQGADSELSWPTALTHGWEGVTKGGSATLDVSTILKIDLVIAFDWVVDALGQPYKITLWDTEFEWSGAKKFDTLLLPGGNNLARIEIVEEVIAGLEYPFDPFEVAGTPVQITLGGDLLPSAIATMSGRKVTTDGAEIATRNGTATIDPTLADEGELEMTALWEGDVASEFGLGVRPKIDITVQGVTFPLSYTWNQPLWSDAKAIASEPVEFEHDLPAVGVPNVLDLGEVLVGEEVIVDLRIDNLGKIDLEGEALYEGDAYISLVDSDFYIVSEQHGTVSVAFAPEQEGDFEGTLILTSNDPETPEIEVQVLALGILPDLGDADQDGDDGDLGAVRGCGCDSTPSPAPAGFLGLMLAGAVLLRRRQAAE